MMNRHLRIGIDVGGTFTHAVAIDAATLEVVSQAKVHTTHRDSRGVAAGIVESLFALLRSGTIRNEEIALIAHSTTQATNALLEGDVSTVGIVGMAAGLGRRRARGQTRIGDTELAPGRFLHTHHEFIDVTNGLSHDAVKSAVDRLVAQGAEVIVASAAFSMEDPGHEIAVAEYCRNHGILVTTGHEISQLYGLRARTRTAVINASMLPRMLETANMTEASVREAGISAPLMIMRSDGGIMDIEQMRRRPILTMLSGPAAGVAAALMYARITDGIFLEVGGTSTDITAIRNGKSLVKSAVVGGHRLYLRTLDVRTVGVAGGSIPRTHGSGFVAVGPRSAHIAGVGYSAFEKSLIPPVGVEQFQPRGGDPCDYVRMTQGERESFSVTPTCAANLLGLVPEGDPAAGNVDCAQEAFQSLASFMGRDNPQQVATELLETATRSVVRVVDEMIDDYELDRDLLTLSGGGGGASAIVPFTARQMKLPYTIAENAAVISAIGAALALVRDTIEKAVMNPAEADILAIRKEAEEAVIRMGANPQSVEVEIEIDAQKNVLRASATGATELRTRETNKGPLMESELRRRAADTVRDQVETSELLTEVGGYHVYRFATIRRMFGGLIRKRLSPLRVIDQDGIIRLQIRNGDCLACTKGALGNELKPFFEKHTSYGDAGRENPGLFVIYRGRMLDLTGLLNLEQIQSVLIAELKNVTDSEPVAAILVIPGS